MAHFTRIALTLGLSLNYVVCTLEQELTPTMFIQGVLNTTDEQDHRVQPLFNNGRAISIPTQARVLKIHSVSETNMEFSLDIVLTMTWKDRRMRFHRLINLSQIEVHAEMMNRIWRPDIYFVNEKNGFKENEPNEEIRRLFLKFDGWIVYSKKSSLKLSCDMDLVWYPHDIQICTARISSFTHTTQQLKLEWAKSNNLEHKENIRLPQFRLNRTWAEECTETSINGDEFACLLIRFELVRWSGYYMLQIYIPSIMIVTVSWVSFWLNVEATPARVSLCVLTLLTMTTQTSKARDSLPRISYVTAIDVWVINCLAFTFIALVEYAFINVLIRCRLRKPKPGRAMSKAVNSLGEKQLFVYGLKPLIEKEEVSTVEEIDYEQGKIIAIKVDKVARVVFPLTFVLFALIYWVVVGNATTREDDTDL